jgi:FkbM family methyltransferase
MINVNYGSVDRNEGYIKNFPTEYSILSQLIPMESPVLFDIGAHQGETIREMIEHLKSPVVHAFEPEKSNFKLLSNTFADTENVHLVNKGVGAVNEKRVFYINALSHTNSFLKVNEMSEDHIRIQKLSESERHALFAEDYNQERLVEITTIDDYCQQQTIKKIDLLKIDTQGFEVDCLKGASRMLHAVKVLKCEVSFFDYYEKSTSFFELESILRPYNLELYSIPFVSQNPENGRTDWLEVIYVNRELL